MNEFAFHPEDKARSLIDRQLAASGWIIQSREDMNLGAGSGIAVREFQTDSGPVDYALFVGLPQAGEAGASREARKPASLEPDISRMCRLAIMRLLRHSYRRI